MASRTDRAFENAFALGRENQVVVELARRHCLHMEFPQFGGQGVAEEVSGLPINMRRVHCPFGTAGGGMAGARLDWIATDFYNQNCLGCPHRQPTGQLPNLASVIEERRAAAADAEIAAEAERGRRRSAWEHRVEQRRSIRAQVDPAMAKALADVDQVDVDPAAAADTGSLGAALARLNALAERAPETYTPDVVDHLLELIGELGLTDLLAPLRRLAAQRPNCAADVVEVALKTLRLRPVVEAARCLVDLRSSVSAVQLDDESVRSLVLLAGAPEQDSFGHRRVASARNDPAGLRVAADLAPETVRRALISLLRTPASVSSLVVPAGVRGPAPGEAASDFDRCAAAGATRQLAGTHPDLATDVIEPLIRSLAVVDDDNFGLHPTADVQRTLANFLVTGVGDVLPALETAAKAADKDYRDRLFGVVEEARRLADPNDRWREPGDPNLDIARRQALYQTLVQVALRRLSGDWGAHVAHDAAILLEQLATDQPPWALPHVSALLSAFITTLEGLERRPLPTLTAVDATPPQMLALEEASRRFNVGGTASRLLRAVEHAANADLGPVLAAVLDILRSERDARGEAEVTWRLLPLLGRLGRAHGHEPGALRTILPWLHTYMVDADAGLRAAAIDAWTEIASRHAVPSSFSDLLPALISDPYVVVIRSVLQAARRLQWDGDNLLRLLAYAVTVVQGAPDSDDETLKSALFAVLSLSNGDDNLRANSEKFVLQHLARLDGYDLRDVLRHRWLPGAQQSADMTRVRLRQARDPAINDRFNAREDEELTALLACGPGLATLSTQDLIDAAVDLTPEYTLASAEFAEVAWRAGRAHDAANVMSAVLHATPDEPVYEDRRALADTLRAAAALDAAAAEDIETKHLCDSVDAALRRLPAMGDEDYWAVVVDQIRASITARALLNGQDPPPLPTATGREGANVPDTTTRGDPAAVLRRRADELVAVGKALAKRAQRSTATAAYVRGFAALCRVASHLLRYDAAELDADRDTATAELTAASRRAAAIARDVEEDLASDDPIGSGLLGALASVAGIDSGEQAGAAVRSWARLPLPIMLVDGRRRTARAQPTTAPRTRPTSQPTPVAVVLASIDGRLVTGPQVLRPSTVYTLRLEVRPGVWPEWATRLDAELISHLTEAEAQTPTFAWEKATVAPGQDSLVGEGTLVLRFGLPAGRPAPPFLVSLRFRGEREGEPFHERCDVAGHAELRLRPFDASRDGLTQYTVVDARLLELYEGLHGAGYDEDQVQAFCRLLTAVCRAGLSMTWEKRYKRGQRVTEQRFHDDLYGRLQQDPELGGRLERGNPSALGYLDVRHDGITAELKVERKAPVTKETAPKYMGQPTQYAAADGARLSVLCILDMSPKATPIGTAENYIWQVQPALHGLTNPEAPSIVTVVTVNGNLPPPSDWSRRRLPNADR